MKLTFAEAIAGTSAPAEVTERLQLIEVPFIDFEGRPSVGQLVVHQVLAKEIVLLFTEIARLSFPIEKINPLVKYGWKDEASMADNNSSGFNYRLISGTNQPSIHSYGRAIDINPRLNPYHGRLGVEPAGATHDPATPGTLTAESPVVKMFEDHGWTWLGHRPEYRDYQHFQKAV